MNNIDDELDEKCKFSINFCPKNIKTNNLLLYKF